MIFREDRYKPGRLDFFPKGETSALKQWCVERKLDADHPITSMMRATGIPNHIKVD